MSSLPRRPQDDQDARFWGPWTDQVIPFTIAPDDDDDAPTEEPTFRPSPSDERELAFLFGEHASYADEDALLEWADNLHHERARAIRRAFDTIRDAIIDFQAERIGPDSLDHWLNTLAPSPEEYDARDFEEVSIIDCHGITG